jgi:GMP synthase-like glutamine amidotransferase
MIIILKHVLYEGPGLIVDMLEGRGVPHKIVEVYEEGVPLGAAGFSALISMGGPMSANDSDEVLEKEKALVREAMDRKIPVLGICLGAQIIAASLGARVSHGNEPEVGWGEVTLTEEGLLDPVLTGSGSPMPVLHWHGETFELPDGAEKLAFSDLYENQAFRVGRNVYGLQFHLEADEEMVQEWVVRDQASGDGLLSDPGPVLDQLGQNLSRVRFAGSLVFGRFLDLVAGRGSGYYARTSNQESGTKN